MGSLPRVLQGQRTHTAPPCSAALRVSPPFPGSQALCSDTALCLLGGACVQSFVGPGARALLVLPSDYPPGSVSPFWSLALELFHLILWKQKL